MDEQSYIKEISRVKKLKRSVEAEVELLRSDMEQGIFHFRVNSDREFRYKIAKAMIVSGGENYYADPVEGRVYYWERNNFKPWGESIEFRIVPVSELLPSDTDFINADIEFVLVQIQDEVTVNICD